MTPIQKACYALIVSAFVLAGLLVLSAQDRFTSSAQGALVLSRDTLTVMTARTRPNEDSLLVLDNSSQKLLIYTLDIAKHRMVLSGSLDLASADYFGGNAGAGGGVRGVPGGGAGPRTPR